MLCRIGRLIVFLGFIGILFVIIGYYRDDLAAQEATGLLDELRQVHTGTKYSDVAEIVKSSVHHGHVSYSHDGIEIVYENKWLHRLRLASYTELRVFLTFKNNTVVDKRAHLFVNGTGCAAVVIEKMHGTEVLDDFLQSNNHKVVWLHDGSGLHVWRIYIEDDDSYAVAARKKDWALNLSCLTQLGNGCRDARRMLPSIQLPAINGTEPPKL